MDWCQIFYLIIKWCILSNFEYLLTDIGDKPFEANNAAVTHKMSAILLLLLASSALGFDVPTSAANRFFDAILEKSFERLPGIRNPPDSKFEFLGVSFQLGDIHISGPTILMRKGNAVMKQATFNTNASSDISLGKIDYDIRKLDIDIFGYKITTAVTFTQEESSATSRVYVVQRDRENCEGSTLVATLSGKRQVRFRSQNGLNKILEYIASVAVDYHLIPVGDIFNFVEFNRYLENELNKSSNEIFC